MAGYGCKLVPRVAFGPGDLIRSYSQGRVVPVLISGHKVVRMGGSLTVGLLRALMALVALGILVAVLGLAYGSLELSPTGEQDGKLRIASSLALAMLLVVESILGLLVRRLSAHRPRRDDRLGRV